MQQLTEIRWHARAGQGAVTAAKLVAETALELDQYIQAMPEYGPERMGAPIQAFTRLSDRARSRSTTTSRIPTSSSCSTRACCRSWTWREGSTDDGIIIVNTCKPPDDVRARARASTTAAVATVDASGISLETLKRDIPNTPMIGALAKVTGLFDARADRRPPAPRPSARSSRQEVIDANVASVTRAYEEVTVGVSDRSGTSPRWTSGRPRSSRAARSSPRRATRSDYVTGGWRSERPCRDDEKCTQCLLCWIVCPDSAINVADEKVTDVRPTTTARAAASAPTSARSTPSRWCPRAANCRR